MPKNKILLTGGAGFIGSHVADELIKLGNQLVILDDLSGGCKENINKEAIFIRGSITDEELIKKLFAEHNFDYVFHLAAYAAEGLSHFIRKFNYENNLIGSINLVNASVNHNIKCFVFTSSIAVYGTNQLPMTENLTPRPEDPYGIAKYAVELDLTNALKMFGLNHIIFRPHNVYGERQNIGDKYRNVIGIFMNQIMQGRPLTVFGDGEQKRAFSYIGDIAPTIARSIYEAASYNQIFNIGTDRAYTINELAKQVLTSMNSQSEINYLPVRNEVKEAYSDHSKINKLLNYKTRTTLREGIDNMATWAKKVGARQSKEFNNIEITKNLPLSWKE